MALVDFVNKLHRSSRRDYLKRVVEHDKAACAEIELLKVSPTTAISAAAGP